MSNVLALQTVSSANPDKAPGIGLSSLWSIGCTCNAK
jgi:hypothetical protein